ncbi:hypothetical protein [Deinococcus hopiensis]|uniref:hypothetical protein n=1 Tax=Deinococcus hopiensis TaxID=309885 RepID=UPI0014829F6F|nr:hypothetical protein [Deinococcus hopiensis]
MPSERPWTPAAHGGPGPRSRAAPRVPIPAVTHAALPPPTTAQDAAPESDDGQSP